MPLESLPGIIARALFIPPMCFVCLFFLGVFLAKKRPRIAKTMRIISLTILFAMGTNQGALLLITPLENMTPPLTEVSANDAQAIVVLTAGRIQNAVELGGHDTPDYVALMRIRYAVKLHRQTQLPILVTGGIGQADGYDESLAAEMARVFEEDFLVPVKWREEASTTTGENAKFSAPILKQAGVKKILLVTDALHIHRSRLAFEKAGLEVIAAPTMFLSHRSPWRLGLRNVDEYFRQSTYAMHEWLGLIWYRLSNQG
jgi:uncharacterized SAM-binding protein YcdF (DUF218 family)